MATQTARKSAPAKAAPKPQAAPVVEEVEEPEVEEVEETEEETEEELDLWADLAEEMPQEYTRNVVISTRDLEKETSPVIKQRVLASYEAYVGAYDKALAESEDKSKATMAAIKASNRVQPCGTEERAELFLKTVKAYGRFKGMTVRGAVNPKDKTQVVWRAKPKEAGRTAK